jgi:glycosyltransferase involved in cell wall biosynthesis
MQPFTGGGVVLSNLFHGFPVDHLVFFHRDQEYGTRSPYREFRVTGRWLSPRLGATLLVTLRWLGQVVRSPRNARVRDLVSLLVQSARVRLPVQVARVVDEFDPQVIYAWTGDALWTEILSAAVRRYRVPYVVHFMDNHVGLMPASPLDRTLHPVFLKRLGKVLEEADSIFTISDSMGVAYQKLFGKRYEVFHGLIDTATWAKCASRKVGKPFTLAFTGSIEQGQMKGLADVARATDLLKSNGFEIRLVLYLTEEYERLWSEELARYACIEIRRHPSFAQLREALGEADLLVLAYGFDERTVNYYLYSFATKVVPYMLSGRCILAYGPASIEPIAYAKRGGWAAVVDRKDIEALAHQIRELADNDERRNRYADAAYDAGLREHDLTLNAQRFRRSLLAVAGSKQGQIEMGSEPV